MCSSMRRVGCSVVAFVGVLYSIAFWSTDASSSFCLLSDSAVVGPVFALRLLRYFFSAFRVILVSVYVKTHLVSRVEPSSATHHRPHTIDHTPSTTHHQPHTTNHAPSTTHHRPHTINHAPSTTHHRPHTIDPTPSTTHHQPRTVDPTPSTTHHQPRTIDHTPSTTHHRPRTIDHTPSTTHHRPHTINHTPSTTHHRPHTIDHAPSVMTEILRTTNTNIRTITSTAFPARPLIACAFIDECPSFRSAVLLGCARQVGS